MAKRHGLGEAGLQNSIACRRRGDFQRPFTMSGHAIGAPRFATDRTLGGVTALVEAAS